MDTRESILVLDQDPKTRDLVSAFLTYKGYKLAQCDGSETVFDTIRDSGVGIVIAEVQALPSRSEIFLEKARTINPFLVLIGYGATPLLHHATEEYIFSISNHLNLEELDGVVMRAREYQAMKQQKGTGTGTAAARHALGSCIIGRSRSMQELFGLIEKVSGSSATVLIQGESGTGKELAARAIHQLSERHSKHFVPVNCGAIPDELLESELFGHVKGSFTGAYANRAGRFEMADKGTLFLDEIGDMKPHLQVKLLRVLQSREFEPVGSTKSQKVDVRIIAATNRNLEELVSTKDFREDLYYRLSVIPITIPPLRERRDDIPLLIRDFLSRFNFDRKHTVQGFSSEALEVLASYAWPGNVRELENLVERMVILKDSGYITPDDLPDKYLSGRPVIQVPALPDNPSLPEGGICLNSAVEEFENRLIMQALQRSRGNKKEAASLLNLKRTTLIEKLKKKNLAYIEEEP